MAYNMIPMQKKQTHRAINTGHNHIPTISLKNPSPPQNVGGTKLESERGLGPKLATLRKLIQKNIDFLILTEVCIDICAVKKITLKMGTKLWPKNTANTNTHNTISTTDTGTHQEQSIPSAPSSVPSTPAGCWPRYVALCDDCKTNQLDFRYYCCLQCRQIIL